MPRILNLTLHEATPEQSEAGVFEASEGEAVHRLLTFESCPDRAAIRLRAEAMAAIARSSGADAAMLGGAPYLMAALEEELRAAGIRPVYAYTVRDSTEARQPDGSVRKTQLFRHAGWVWA